MGMISPVDAQFTHGKLIDQRWGLSDTRVKAIGKDYSGFVWIGTQKGLNRFDGSQIRQFLHDPDDSTSILNNDITAMVIDSGRLWVGGPFGISALNLTDFSVKNIQFDCDSILTNINLRHKLTPTVTEMRLEDSILWIATRECGLMRYNIHEHELIRISFAEHRNEVETILSAASLDLVRSFVQDPNEDSIFWAGTAAGLIRLNKITRTHELFFNEREDLLYQDAINMHRRIIYHDDGRIYYLTWHWGINVFDPETNEFYPLPFADSVDINLRHSIADFRKHDQYSFWIRTVDGLYLYNTSLQKITSFYPNEDPSLRYRPVYFQDEKNRRWFATNVGIHIYDPLFEQFLVFPYKELNEPTWSGFARKIITHPDGGTITVLGQSVDGLYHYSHRNNKWFETSIPGYDPSAGRSFSGVDFEASDEFGWVYSGTDGIYSFDPETFVSREINLNIELGRQRFSELTWDRDGDLWIGTRNEGLLRYDPDTKSTTQYISEIYGTNVYERTPESHNLMCDSKGNIWFTTAHGHSVYQFDSGEFHNFNVDRNPEHTVSSIANFTEDRRGTVWCVSHNGEFATGSVDQPAAGLQIQCSVFQNGLTPSYVEGVVAGITDQKFVLCEGALIRIDSTMSISHFSFEYADFIGDFYCFDNLSEASLVVGLRNQFAVLNTLNLRRNTEMPIPYLTGVAINEVPLTGNYISATPVLDLKYNENFVSFSFSAISYTLPEKNTFRYRLRGFDPDWIVAGDRRYANYTNIPSGEYTFELQVANNEGYWNPAVYRVPTYIARPWWGTWWFRIGAFVLVVSGVIMIYRYRVNQIRKETKLKAEFEKKIGDIELSALRAQMNPHFIFNSLNSIENYIIKNESIKAAEYINDFARLMRLILQNSRSQYIPLKDEIEALELYVQMESLRFDSKFEYKINIDPDLELSEVDIPPMMIQPFVENAIWHGLIPKAGPGKLEIDLAQQNGSLRCVIQDNGIGRQKSQKINASMHKRGKKSMGMLITKNRIDVFNELYQTNATVDIHDLKDEEGNPAGTKVDLNIPIE